MTIRERSTTAAPIGAIGATHLAVDLVGGGFAAMLPSIAERMSLSNTAVGVLVALFSASALGSQPFMGGLADRFGARHVTVIGALVAAALLSAAAVVASLPLLIATIVVGGLAAAAFHPAGAVLAMRHGPDSPESAVATFAAAGTVGLALGPIAAISLVGGAGASGMLLFGIPALVIAPAAWRWSRAHVPIPAPSRALDRPPARCSTGRSHSWQLPPRWSPSSPRRSHRHCLDGSLTNPAGPPVIRQSAGPWPPSHWLPLRAASPPDG